MSENERKVRQFKDLLQIPYSHCIKYTAGQLDREPFSQYERRVVSVELREWAKDANHETEEYEILVNGRSISGCNADIEQSIHEAAYFLMSDSRDVEEKKTR